jgi:hypothetical protein
MEEACLRMAARITDEIVQELATCRERWARAEAVADCFPDLEVRKAYRELERKDAARDRGAAPARQVH